MPADLLARGELQVKIFHLRKKLVDLGEEVQEPPPCRGGGRDGAARDRALADALEAQLAAALEPRRRRRAADADRRFPGEDSVHFLVRRALRRCGRADELEREFRDLRKRAGSLGDPSGRVFSLEDLEGAQERCLRELLRRAMEESDSEDGGEEAAGTARRAGAPPRAAKPRRRPQGGRGGAAAAPPQFGEQEDEDDEEADLDGEQAIDLDEALDEKGMRGLKDMFESRQPPVAEDEWGRAWRAVLPAGAWCAATLRGRLQRRGVEMPEGSSQSYPAPGHPGFNKYAAARLKLGGIGDCSRTPSGSSGCPPMQPHQQSVAFLLHPCSPISRMLVDHPTGCGKTREMIQVLDQYFKDPRPKVAIFPTEAVCRNFYAELLRWPSRYRDFFCCEEPALARRAAGLGEEGDWRERRGAFWSLAPLREAELRRVCLRARECLEMQGTFVMGKLRKSRLQRFRQANPGELFPWAPLRALGYTSAGGSNIKLDPETGRPLSSLFKVGFGEPFSNVYDRKIVLMDEVHNLIRARTQFAAQLEVLRARLAAAEDCVIVGFTATPIPDHPSEGRLLLDTFKGDANVGRTDEGFVSSFPFKPWRLFPRCLPRRCATGATLDAGLLRELCRPVELQGDALLHYDLKARDPQVSGRRLQAYCNMFCWGGAFHDGQNGCKAEVMERPEVLAPKLLAIARAVASGDGPGGRSKALVLVSRRTGYLAMVALLREVGRTSTPPFRVATMDQLAEFNAADNLRGGRFLALVANTAECGEGISFRAVRRQLLADVPATPTALVQQCGRANRMYGHAGLRPEEQTLTIQLFTAVHPSWMRGDALATWCFRVHGRKGASGDEAEQCGRRLRERLRAKGVRSLEDLKARLDRFGAGGPAPRAAAAPRGRGQPAGQRQQAAAPVTISGKPAGQRPQGRGAAAARSAGDAGLADERAIEFMEATGLAEEARALRQAGGEAGGAAPEAAALRQRARHLQKALQALCAADGAGALRVAAAGARTEDQRACELLQGLFAEFGPAVAAFRACAVDKAVLEGLERAGALAAPAQEPAGGAAAGAGRRRLRGKQRPGASAASRRASVAGPTARRFSRARAPAGRPAAAEAACAAGSRAGPAAKRPAEACLGVATPLRKRARGRARGAG